MLSILRHAQDRFNYCGFASAQMVISGLTRDPAAASTTSLPVKQKALEEVQQGLAIPGGGHRWWTTPDELAAVLNKWKTANDRPDVGEWEVVIRATLNDFLEELQKSLDAKMPVIVNIFSTNHWVVVVGLTKAGGAFKYLQYQDPLGVDANVDHAHKFEDACQDLDSAPSFRRIDPDDADLKIEPDETYILGDQWDGKYVAVVGRDFVSPGAGGGPTARPSTPIAVFPELPAEPAARQEAAVKAVMEQLSDAAVELGLPRVERPHTLVRAVMNAAATRERYLLGAIHREQDGKVLIGIFTPDKCRLKDFRVTTDLRMFKQLEMSPREKLCSRDSPYFPVVGTPGPEPGRTQFRRLINGEVLYEPREL